ncbi:hypothetical protein [Bacillus swezeyi]|uniref:hypothetical protein n=1 Tax=Bacillus swezeyi TaxID=1925020 RepID=UPI00123C61F3|nr:hypothetical protein [Bacillus swezeyi]KAA6475750.1 hypothetical protein DX928_06485 [Bacillus swezeyi]
MDNAEKELKRLKDGIEIALNNLQTRYGEVLKRQEEIKKEVDDVLFKREITNQGRQQFYKKYNQLSLDAHQNGGELQALSFAIGEIKYFYNSTNESN